jgi:hypothetical protein
MSSTQTQIPVSFLFIGGSQSIPEGLQDRIDRGTYLVPSGPPQTGVYYNGEFYPVGWNNEQQRLLPRNPGLPQDVYDTVTDLSDQPGQVKTLQPTKPWAPPVDPKLGIDDIHWLSLMLDDETDQIIGYYVGNVDYDNLGRRYNTYSYLQIRPDYHGTGLCGSFSQYTYAHVASIMGVEYFCISIRADNPVAACRCYAQAAINLGFKVYVDSAILRAKDYCSVISRGREEDKHMFIVTNPELDLDDEMQAACID